MNTSQGKRLKKIRQSMELSQEEFGKLLGVSKQYVSNLEADRNTLNNEKLVSLLVDCNINLNYLLADIGEPFIPPKFEDVKDEILKEVDDVLIKYGVKNK